MIRSAVGGIYRFFSGCDVFISYSRLDGEEYAVALASALAKKKLRCAFDHWQTSPGLELPPTLVRRLRHSSFLVLVSTDGSGRSERVEQEIKLFLSTGRSIIPIDVDGSIERARWSRLVTGASVSKDRAEPGAGDHGMTHSPGPSSRVLERITNSVGFLSWDRKLKATSATTVLVAGAFAWYFGDRASDAQAENVELSTANTDLREEKAGLEGQIQRAGEDLAKAETRRTDAIKNALTAGAARINDAITSREQLHSALLSTLENFLALDADEIAVPGGLQVALTEALASTRSGGTPLGAGHYPRIEDSSVSRDGELLLTVGVPWPAASSAAEVHVASLWRIRTQEWLGNLEESSTPMTACALAPDGASAAIAFNDGRISIVSCEGPRGLPMKELTMTPPISHVGFEQTGQRIISWSGGSTWNGRNISLIDRNEWNVRPITFAEEIFFLGFGPGWLDRPYLVFASFTRAYILESATGEVTELDLGEESRYLRKSGSLWISRIAISPDGRWVLADASGVHAAILFDRLSPPEEPGGILERARMLLSPGAPRVTRAHRLPAVSNRWNGKPLAFSPDGARLVVAHEEGGYRSYRLPAVGLFDPSDNRELQLEVGQDLVGFSADGSALLVENRTHETTERRIVDLDSGKVERILGASDFWDSGGWRPAADDTFHVLGRNGLAIAESPPSSGARFGRGHPMAEASLSAAVDVAVSPDAKLAASAHINGEVALWDLGAIKLIGVIKNLGDTAPRIEWAVRAEAGELLCSSGSGRLYRWSPLRQLRVVADAPKLVGPVETFLSANGEAALARGGDGGLRIWLGGDWQDPKVAANGPIALASDGSSFAHAESSGGVSVFNQRGDRTATLFPPAVPLEPDQLCFAACDERLVASYPGLGACTVWASTGGQPLWEGGPRHMEARVMELLHPGLWTVRSDDGTGILDLITGDQVAWIPGIGHSGGMLPLDAASIRPSLDVNQGLLAFDGASSSERRLQIWDQSKGQTISYTSIPWNTRRIQLVPGRRALVTISPTGSPQLLPLDTRGQFEQLVPFLVSSIKDVDEHGNAYRFCLPYLKRIQSRSGGLVPSPPAWTLDAQLMRERPTGPIGPPDEDEISDQDPQPRSR